FQHMSLDGSIRRDRAGQRRRPAIVVALAITAIVLTACGSAAQAPIQGAPAAGRGGQNGTDTGAPKPVTGGVVDGSGTGVPKPQDVVPDPNLIIRTGTMTIEVASMDAALLRARTAITGLGGYISASDQANDGDKVLASVTYRFPSARWEDAQAAIREVATKLIGAKTGSSEVTGQVLDLGARIANLRATEQALQAIMAKATKISDILEVQNQLTGVQGQIEQLSTQQAHLRDQASLATLTVLFQTPATAVVKEVSKGWDFGAELDKAAGQLLSVGQVLATVGVWLAVVGLPVFGATIIFLLVFLFLARRIGRLLAPWFGRYAASTDGGNPGV
ncbi:MAG: DUF4349 domain-containing protein, partial [Chloroflexota bacterium]|nr:DUF4349 domain-containing protein [Chloroflexota bacterium]